MKSSARPAAAAVAAPSSSVGQQIPSAQAYSAAGTGSAAKLRSEVLEDAARAVEANTPWYEKLGLRCGAMAGNGSDMAVEAVLAVNVVGGLIDAANQTLLAPVFVLLKGLLGAVQGAAAARGEIVELARYCVGISRCLLEASNMEHMPSTVVVTLGEFKGEMEAVVRFVQSYGIRKGGFRRKVKSSSRNRRTVAGHKRKLQDLLEAVLAGLAAQTYQRVNEVKAMITDRDPPPLPDLAEVPREAPIIPPTYVERADLKEQVVQDLVDFQRSPSATHCVLGMGGQGKTLLASSVVRDDRVRAAFKNGIFWVPVGREGKNVALLLEYLAVQLARAPTDTPHDCPHRFDGAEEAARYLSAVLENNGLRCLVVLDNVWGVEVVSAFASTGFHVLVTTRQETVVSPVHAGVRTEVGNMSKADALEVLRKSSRASGPLPADAEKVADDCCLLPLALGIVGNLARDEPLDPVSWRRLHDKLQEKAVKFRRLENGTLFSMIETSLRGLPSAQQEQLQLMAVMASGVAATPEMLANLWAQHISDVSTGASILVGHCLLQDMRESYRLHDLVLEYLQLVIKMEKDQTLARQASSRQAQYLGRLDVLRHYSRGEEASTGGIYSLMALWNSVKKLDRTIDVQARYVESLYGVTKMRAWEEVGDLLLKLGYYAGAEAMLKRSLKMVDESVDERVRAIFILDDIAWTLDRQGKYQKADELIMMVIEMKEKMVGPDDLSLCPSLSYRVRGLARQGRYQEADRLHRRLIAIQNKFPGPGGLRDASSLYDGVDLLLDQGKLAEADVLILRVIDIEERSLGPDHPSLGSTLSSRARLLAQKGKYDEAELLLRRAVEIEEKWLGDEHPHCAGSLNNRGNMLAQRGKHIGADLLYLRAIKIQEERLGPHHPSLANTLGNRATLLATQGKHEEADRLRVRAFAIIKNALGPEHPRLCMISNNRAATLLQWGRYAEADSLFAWAINIQEKRLGRNHPEIGLSLGNRASLFAMQGQHIEADVLYRRSIEIFERALGPDHPDLGSTLGNRADTLVQLGKLEEADRLYARSVDVLEKALGADNLSLASVLHEWGVSLSSKGKIGDARRALEKALAIRRKALGERHEITIGTFIKLKGLDES